MRRDDHEQEKGRKPTKKRRGRGEGEGVCACVVLRLLCHSTLRVDKTRGRLCMYIYIYVCVRSPLRGTCCSASWMEVTHRHGESHTCTYTHGRGRGRGIGARVL